MDILYCRVSTIDQNLDRQLEIPADKVFTEKVSGKSTENRQALAAAIEYAREGDSLHFFSFDRAARSLSDLINIINTLTAKKVKVIFHKENLTFTGEDDPMNNLMLGLLGSVAEYERALIVARVREGCAIAKAKGNYRHVGRKAALSADTITELRKRHADGARPTDLARLYGVSRATIYNYLAAND